MPQTLNTGCQNLNIRVSDFQMGINSRWPYGKEIYSSIVAQIQDELIEKFKDFHLRAPTLEEEIEIHKNISYDEVKARMKDMTGGHIDPNFSIEISKHLL